MLSTAVDYYDDAGEAEGIDDDVEALTVRADLTPDGAKLLLVMVGMPARGKSFISHKLCSFLSWSGYKTRTFNAGQRRRKEPAAPTAAPPADEALKAPA